MASASTPSPLRGEGRGEGEWDALSTSALAGTAPLPTLSPEGRGLSAQRDGTPA